VRRRVDRKRTFDAPLHVKRKLMHVHLSPELREKAKVRAVLLRKGDKVKVMRGNFKGKEGVVAGVNYKYCRVYLEGFSRKNSRGEEKLIPFHPSNLQLIEMFETKERKAKFPAIFERGE
jgi:large subunit ribosomal protein L24